MKENRKYNGQKKTDKKKQKTKQKKATKQKQNKQKTKQNKAKTKQTKNNGLQKPTQKDKDWSTRTPIKKGVNSDDPKR